jgi:peptidoglycan/xylan/chitin deacetylase (PgdA/CDA1 family)
LLLLAVIAVTFLVEFAVEPSSKSHGQLPATINDALTPYAPVLAQPVSVSAHHVISADIASASVINVPILMYHHIGNPATWQTYSVDTAMFEWQMDYLDKHGFHTVSLDDISAAIISGTQLPGNPIAITFDDGWALQYTNTLPSLLRHHFRATYYIIVNATGRINGVMTWDQVRLLRDAGMWIGSHTLSHGYLPGMSNAKLREEMVDSKRLLEEQLGVPVTTFAYPGGAFDARVERMAQEAGYTTAVSVIHGYDQRSDEIYRLRRVGVYGVDTQERFIAKVDQSFFNRTWPYPTGQANLSMANPEQ